MSQLTKVRLELGNCFCRLTPSADSAFDYMVQIATSPLSLYVFGLFCVVTLTYVNFVVGGNQADKS